MRKTLTIILALGLLAGMAVAPAEAGKKKRKKPYVRTFEVPYDNPAFGVGGVGGGCSGCPGIPTGKKDLWAIIEIVDDLSPVGYIDLAYDSDGDGIQNLDAGPTVCGSTPEPVTMEPGVTYTAWPWLAGAECAGSSTSGTIKVTFSNNPKVLEKRLAKGD